MSLKVVVTLLYHKIRLHKYSFYSKMYFKTALKYLFYITCSFILVQPFHVCPHYESLIHLITVQIKREPSVPLINGDRSKVVPVCVFF